MSEVKLTTTEANVLRTVLGALVVKGRTGERGLLHGADRFVSTQQTLRKPDREALDAVARKLGLTSMRVFARQPAGDTQPGHPRLARVCWLTCVWSRQAIYRLRSVGERPMYSPAAQAVRWAQCWQCLMSSNTEFLLRMLSVGIPALTTIVFAGIADDAAFADASEKRGDDYGLAFRPDTERMRRAWHTQRGRRAVVGYFLSVVAVLIAAVAWMDAGSPSRQPA